MRDLLSLVEAGQTYHVSRATLVRWIAAGRLRPEKLPRDRLT